MFVLLAAVLPPPNPALVRSVEVAFPDGRVVRVPRPEPVADFPANLAGTLLSPRGDAAAVRFCWDIPKYDSCQVHLVRPSGAVQVLKNSNVRRLLWTADGKYLIGAGVNTVRLWNLVGGVRSVVPTPGEVYPRPFRRLSRISGLDLLGGDLCVRTADQWYAPTGQQAGRSVSATRYALPTLRPLQVLSFAAEERQQIPCHLPVTEP